ncbi:MAG: hypothetical protein M3O71_22840 [Bacteroidota bacterium]|nr:hypothetical protein [Bacteroidota bacterium]
MKKIILTLVLLASISVAALAQCDKTAVLTSSKTGHIDAGGALIKTVTEAVVIEISQTEVNVSVDGDPKIKATINSKTCDWKVPFKEGKTVIHAIGEHDGNNMPVTVTIEGKAGKVTLLFQRDEHPEDRVTLDIDKFTEKV